MTPHDTPQELRLGQGSSSRLGDFRRICFIEGRLHAVVLRIESDSASEREIIDRLGYRVHGLGTACRDSRSVQREWPQEQLLLREAHAGATSEESAERVSRMNCWRRLPTLVGLLVFAACGGSDVPTGPEGTGGSDPPPSASPSFSSEVNPILTAKGCTAGNCHGGGQAGLTLTSSAPSNYANLVNVQSSDPSFLLVEPGDAQNSYLVMKVEGRAGSRMPVGGAALTSNQIQTMRNWIDSGAPNN